MLIYHIEDNQINSLMDIEELIIETLRLAEQMELEDDGPPHIYTCLVKNAENQVITDSVFSDVVLTGELCVCAHTSIVATFLFFIIHGIFDHAEHRLEWYTQELEHCLEYDDVTPEAAIKLWTERYVRMIQIKEHDISQPIVIYPMEHAMVTLTPSICDIWTLPRVKRQFTD